MGESNRLRIGCPVWSCPHWRGSVYSAKSPRGKWLSEYSRVFPTVEGNSTFYGIPSVETFKRWAEETAPGFRFVLKFPRTITHDKQFENVGQEVDSFLSGLEVLRDAERLGPSFIQLPPSFGPSKLELLRRFTQSLPDYFPYAVEVRHLDFFVSPAEDELNHLLTEIQMDRVIFDSRPLFSGQPDDEIEAASQQRKPRSPVRMAITGRSPIVRLVGRNRIELVKKWTEEWAQQTSEWVNDGLEPYLFTHTPDDRYAPDFAKMFEQEYRRIDQSSRLVSFRSCERQIQQTLF